MKEVRPRNSPRLCAGCTESGYELVKAFIPVIKRGLAMIGANLANFALTLGRNKLLAIYLGPAGIGWIALVNNLIEAAAVVGGMGVCDAYNRELPRKRPEFSQSAIVSSGMGLFALTLLLAIPVSTAVFVQTVDVPSNMVIAAISFAIAATLASAWRAVGGIYLGFGLSRRMFKAIVLSGVGNLVLAGVLLVIGVRDLMIYVLMTPAFLALAGISGAWPHFSSLVNWHEIKTMPARKPILTIALPIVAGLLLEPLTILLLRSETARRFGEEGVGLVQPGMLFVILAASLANAFLGMTISRWDQSEEHAFSKKFLALLAAAIVLPLCGIAVVFLRGPIWPFFVSRFFTSAFVAGAATIPWFVSGELMRIGGIMLNHTLLSRKLGYATILPRLACLLTVIVAIQLGKVDSILAVGQAYAAAYAAYLVFSILLWLLAQLHFRKVANS